MSARRRRRWVDIGLTALTYLVLLRDARAGAVAGGLVACRPSGELANGDYDLLHPTLDAFGDMWRTVDFERYLINSLVICTGAAALATAFAAPPGYALARFRFRGDKAYGADA